MTATGLNVWFDLMTTDVEGAKRFYGEVIGWKTTSWDEADPNMPYTMFTASGAPVGGIMPLNEGARQAGAPSHWMAYTTVPDVDATVEKARSLGAKVHAPPTDIPTVGRFAVLADPQGASFAILAPTDESAAPPDAHGQFSWAELHTTDYEAAWKFYSALFGWKHRSSMEMGELGTYFMFHDESEQTRGGMSNGAKVMGAPPHWLHYVTVDDMSRTLERVKAHGGAVLHGPMDIPGNDVVATCRDPQGAHFAVYAHGKR